MSEKGIPSAVKDCLMLPFSDGFPFASYLGLCVVAVLLGLLLPRIRRPGAAPIFIIVVATALWYCGEFFETPSTDLGTRLIWAQTRYLGIVVLPTAWFVFACQFGQRRHWVRPRNIALLSVFPILTLILVWTSEYHMLFWRQFWLDFSQPIPVVRFEEGTFYWLHTVYSYTLILLATWILYRTSRHAGQQYRKQARLVIFAVAFPIVANVFFQLGVRPKSNIDLTPAMLIVTCAMLTWNLLSRGFLNPPIKLARNLVVQSMGDGIIVVDLDGTIVDLNPAAQSMLQGSQDGLLGRPLKEILTIPPLTQSCPEGSKCHEIERADESGLRHFYELHVSPVIQPWMGHAGYVIDLRDVTAQRHAEEEHRRLFAAIEQVGELVVITDIDGKVTYANPAFVQATGYERLEVYGQDLRFLTKLRQGEPFEKSPLDVRGFADASSTRCTIHDKTGKGFLVDVSVSPIQDGQGRRIGYVLVQRNVTEHVRLENALRQAQKMETVGQLAGGVAHDFNNLLQVIGGCAEVALQDLDPENHASVMIGEIVRAGDRAARLVRQLLTFSRQQAIAPENIDLNTVIGQLLKMLERVIGEHIDIEFLTRPSLPYVYADRGQIEQVITNLAVNARDAMPHGGKLTIEMIAATFGADSTLIHPWATPGPYVGFSIADTGCGMDAQTLERIFEPFFTTKEGEKGTGLGLATVYGIVKQHGGIVSVYSEVGQGSVFKVYLPVAEGMQMSDAPASKDEATGGDETILLAEDDTVVRNLTRIFLEEVGYTVLEARDGIEALRIADQQGARIALTVLDVIMPGLGGRAVYERLRGRFPQMRFLFASGYSPAMLHGHFVFDKDLVLLQKPFERRQFLVKVREILDRD